MVGIIACSGGKMGRPLIEAGERILLAKALLPSAVRVAAEPDAA